MSACATQRGGLQNAFMAPPAYLGGSRRYVLLVWGGEEPFLALR